VTGPAAPAGRSSVRIDVSRVPFEGSFVRVSSIGTSGERAFVLVAGIGVAATYYERLAPNLNEFGPVHALDLPGFAGVPHPRGRITIERYADAVERALDALGLDDPVLVGHSMGTQIVSEVAARRPALSRVVLISPVVNAAERKAWLQGIRFIQSSVHEPLKVALLAVAAYALCGFRWFFAVLPAMIRFPIEERFENIRAATLVIRGEHDALCPRPWVRDIARMLPEGSTWEIEGAAHSVMHDHAEAVARLCVEHVRGAADAGEDARLRVVEDAAAAEEPPNARPRLALRAILGRLIELRGTVTGDDRRIARGKTQHAEAMAEAYDSRGAEKRSG
jgi:pimeloyl-ACP methyl ester carboxylesterase